MAYRITLQKPKSLQTNQIPAAADFKKWIKHTLQHRIVNAEIVVRIVELSEGKDLNYTYRQKDYATNVLSFPYELTDVYVMGDIVLCAPVVFQEAEEQKKDILSYWAHLTVHGTLHLLGYDHLNDADAQVMQTLEVKILKEMGFTDPY